MKTTKFGLKITVFAALIYFCALQNAVAALLLIGYALLVESTDAMRKMSCQALIVLGGVWGISSIYALLNGLVSVLNSVVGVGYLHLPYGLGNLVSLLLDGALVAFGVLALLGRYDILSPAALDKVLDKAQAAAAQAGKTTTSDGDAKK